MYYGDKYTYEALHFLMSANTFSDIWKGSSNDKEMISDSS